MLLIMCYQEQYLLLQFVILGIDITQNYLFDIA